MKRRFPIRGGNWNNGASAGLGALNLNNARSNANSNIGVRPASCQDSARSIRLTRRCPCSFKKDGSSLPIGKTEGPQPLDASGECIFQEIVSFDNLLSAAELCKRGRAKKAPSLRFFDCLEENIISLQNELIWGSYEPGPYTQFYVFEPKRRRISAPHFRDRVAHRAIYNVLNPLFDARYIYDSYACRQGKGTHRGADRAQYFLQQIEKESGRAYALKADIHHYFSSINHETLKIFLRQKIGCERAVELLEYIIDTSPADAEGVGIPLGNLTSQMFANIYLHELDIFVKHGLKAKRYVRYMDDFVLLHRDKSILYQWRKEVELFLADALQLRTNSKTQIFPVGVTRGRALDFLGYRIYSSHRLLRKCSVKRIKTKLKKFHKAYAGREIDLPTIRRSLTSWLGHASHASAYQLTKKLLKEPFRRGDREHV